MLRVNHADASALATAVAARIAAALDEALAVRGAALLALAGGRTSPPVFRALAAQPRDWSRVSIAPSDERWVARTHPDCNLAQLQAAFAGAQGIEWLPLVPESPASQPDARFANEALAAHPEAFDVAMLGMGADGHFASIFPGAANLAEALVTPVGAGLPRDRDASKSRGKPAPAAAPDAIAIVPDPLPAAGPHPRISLTLARLLHSRLLLLVVTGADKRAALEHAQREGDWRRLPVAALLRAAHPQAEIHWSP